MPEGQHVGMTGTLQGRYEILAKLGQGGAGSVYLCRDLRIVDKKWAVKEVMCQDLESLRRFEREAAMLSRLRHPNFPLVADFFTEGERQYLVMEYVEGKNLDGWISQNGPASPAQAVAWGECLVEALNYLHGQKPPIIFGDLKPANIMLDSDGELKLVDFGLAAEAEHQPPVNETQGSAGYAAPEQWEADQPTDARTDLYALGATLYFLVSGRHPPPMAGQLLARGMNLNVEEALEAIIRRCIQPSPADRFQSAQEVGVALRQLGAARPARASKTRPPLLWLVALLLCLALLLVLPTLVKGPPVPKPSPSPTAPVKDELSAPRRFLAEGHPAQAIPLIEAFLEKQPHDVEARLLRQNASALESGKPVWRVPVLIATTGVDGKTGAPLLRGMVLAQEVVNRSDVHKLVLDLHDNASEGRSTLELAQRFSDDPSILAVLGPQTSQHTMMAAPVFNSSGLCMLTPSSSDPRVWEAGPCVFAASDSMLPRVGAIARWLAGHGKLRGLIAGDNDSRLKAAVADFFTRELTKGGGKVLAEALYRIQGDDETAFQGVAEEVKRTQPDFVFVAEYRGDVVAHVARTLRRAEQKQMIGTQAVPYDAGLLSLGPEPVEGLILASYFNPRDPAPEVHDFVARCQSSFAIKEPSHLEATAYDATLVLVEALKVADTRQGVQQYLTSIGRDRPVFKGLTGPFAVSKRLDLRPVHVLTIKDGAYQDLPP